MNVFVYTFQLGLLQQQRQRHRLQDFVPSTDMYIGLGYGRVDMTGCGAIRLDSVTR